MANPLSVTALRVKAESGQVLLELPRLTLARGQSLGIRGPSGAGKSTLLYALAGLLDHVSGQVCWGDTDVAALGKARCAAFRQRHIGMIFQDFLLFEELDAVANASLVALFRPRRERAAVVARAREQLARLGIDTLSRHVVSFSGGERQRVAVARALATDPDILLADEPTASLHREAADALSEDLLALAKEGGKTLIVVSHDQSLLARMDHVLEVADGRPRVDLGADSSEVLQGRREANA